MSNGTIGLRTMHAATEQRKQIKLKKKKGGKKVKVGMLCITKEREEIFRW
jgi:hypothetical protein